MMTARLWLTFPPPEPHPGVSNWKPILGRSFTPTEFDRYVAGLELTWTPKFVVLHNTASPTLAQWHHVPGEERMRNLADYYRHLGWSAGPHLFVADDLIWVFTPLTTPGTHSPSWNAVSWGVEMVGDYDAEPFDARVRDNAVSALAALHVKAAIDSHSLHLHREDPKTTHSCPGRHVDKADMIRRVHEEILRRKAASR
jgi:hypothetical protein